MTFCCYSDSSVYYLQHDSNTDLLGLLFEDDIFKREIKIGMYFIEYKDYSNIQLIYDMIS